MQRQPKLFPGILVMAMFPKKYKSFEEFWAVIEPVLFRHVKYSFAWMSDDDVSGWLQHVAFRIVEGQYDEPRLTVDYLQKVITNAILDYLRKKERQVLSMDGLRSEDGSPMTFKDLKVATPSEILIERERHDRRERLLSDILREWSADCEDRGAWRERECTERNLRGQSHQQAASETGIRVQTQHVMSAQGFNHLRELIEREDVNRSVFATLFGGNRDRTPLPPDMLPEHQQSREALITWLIECVGVLCFSDSIIRTYQNQETPLSVTARSAIDYHVNATRENRCGCRNQI